MTFPDPVSWVGHTETCADSIDAGHVEKIALSFASPVPACGSALPSLWHWALFVKALPYDQLGDDGHPKRGGF
ncbi:MAG: itaconyl-CoA hydratase, partial [Burkholderiaceae bacterium]